MKIGEVAACAGVSTATIRYYERRRLISPSSRTPSGYRQYEAGAAQRLQPSRVRGSSRFQRSSRPRWSQVVRHPALSACCRPRAARRAKSWRSFRRQTTR